MKPILKEINTQEEKENMKKFIEKYISKENEKSIKMKEMFSNTDYLK